MRLVAQYVSVRRSGQVPVGPQQAELPALAVRLLRDILAHLANGTAVRILPLHARLSVDARRSPGGVVVRQLDDERAQLRILGRPPGAASAG